MTILEIQEYNNSSSSTKIIELEVINYTLNTSTVIQVIFGC